jgi:hypothetical protein
MRRDAFLANDSGGLSILAGDAIEAVIEDGRESDARFAAEDKVILLELYGDDAMPVRIVVDEPLQPEEEAEWLARVSRPIETTDGRILVMGGFDPDVLGWWRDETGGGADGKGVLVVQVPPGRWRVDLYAHAGSMNGRQVVEAEFAPIGRGFRADHPDRPFPLWLAKWLDWSGEEDPGHEAAWADVRGSLASGALAVDTDGTAAIGFLVHVTPDLGPYDEVPDGAWFALDTNARKPARFPLGLSTTVSDPDIEGFLDRLLKRERPDPPRPIATSYTPLIAAWSGAPLAPLDDDATVELAPRDAYLLYWLAGMTSDSSAPRFEILVEGAAGWSAPDATPDVAVQDLGDGVVGIGPVGNQAGWGLWWAARAAAQSLGGLPDGTTLTLAAVPYVDDAYGDDDVPAGDAEVGRAMFSGTVSDGAWRVDRASPAVSSEALRAAVAFARDVAQAARLTVRPGEEREAFDEAAEMFTPGEGELVWSGNAVALAEPQERTLILLAGPVFRVRFADTWTMGADEDDDEDDEDDD